MANNPRNILITGAGSGIGAAVAKVFADAGDRVHLLDISDERLGTVAEGLPDDRVETHAVDVTDFDSVQDAVRRVAEHGSIDVLAGCAGVFDGLATVETTTPELWHRIIDINLTGTFNVVKPVAEQMIRQKSGSIVLMSSIAAHRATPDGLAYDASKAGIEGMVRRLAVDLGPHGITANTIAPGVIKTGIRATSEEILGELVPDTNVGVGTNSDLQRMLLPLQRPADASEVASVVFFLGGEGASYISGDVIHVDGGWIAA
ncbi:MAG: SDR family NAD(P)-dependent oxidoreductase [Gulosibacter sp.]|uniref:SDR family NAD(P)-dependent oxidoreductase n=1 Tax=Gulosibacter sp. TaxID=2817531 RepID=UPI003F8E514C